ncbi:MAG TPA: hypothetical protein VF782_11765 [Allosphingosinicella sp.]|jgi:hypothetical protein
MARALGLPFVAALLQAAQPAAGACLAPDKVVERMDEYFSNPRGAATYRALAGLGDPRIDQFEYRDLRFWYQDDDRPLLERMLPVDSTEMGGSHYRWIETGECRPGYALQTARARIARLGSDHPYVRHWFEAQRATFSACAGRDPPLQAIPAALPLPDPAVARLQRDDRAWQAASQLFYRKSAAAPAAFRRIAASSSEHAPMARYMMLAIKSEWPPLKSPPVRRPLGGDRQVPPMDQTGPSGPVPVGEILADARSILADRRLASIHALTQGLIGSIGYAADYESGGYANPDRGLAAFAPEIRREQVRLTLEALQVPLGRLRSDPVARERYARALADIDKLHGDFPDPYWGFTGAVPDKAFASRAMAAAAKSDRLAAWSIAPRSPYERRSWARAEREHRDSYSWLIFMNDAEEASDARAWEVADASLTRRHELRPWPDAAMERALRCPDDASLAALPALFYHRVRDGLMSDRPTENPGARVEEVLSRLKSWPWQDSRHYRATVAASLRYLIASGRIRDARKLRDGLVLKDEYGSHYDLPLLLLAEDEDRFVRQMAVADVSFERPVLFNLLSTEALTRLAGRGDVPAEERARFARVAWSRLYAMGRPIPAGLDRLMRRLNPEITAAWISRPGRGARPSDRRLLLDVLRSPALNIVMADHQRAPQAADREAGFNRIDTHQHSDNNWWCAWQVRRHDGNLDELLYGQFYGPHEGYFRADREDPLAIAGARTTLGPLLDSSYLWNARGTAEQQKLSKIDCAPKLLSERAIAWKGKGLDGQDEALALAVRATRYGCQRQGGHGAYSKAAFALLHKRFPQSAAAKRTRYWFDCAHFSAGCPAATSPSEDGPSH